MMDISAVAKQSGFPASTLRYYETKGLITSTGRRGLHRLYSPNVLEQLALIALGRAAGLSLDEIGQMFGPGGKVEVDRQLLTTKADEIDKTIKNLTTMRDGLRHAAACTVPSHLECPKFRRLMGLAAAKTAIHKKGKMTVRKPRPQR